MAFRIEEAGTGVVALTAMCWLLRMLAADMREEGRQAAADMVQHTYEY